MHIIYKDKIKSTDIIISLKRNHYIEFILITIIIINISLYFIQPSPYINNEWNSSSLMSAYWSVDMLWNEPIYGLSNKPITVNINQFLVDVMGTRISTQNNIYGKKINEINEVVDYIDYIARYLYSQVIYENHSIEKAYELAYNLKTIASKNIDILNNRLNCNTLSLYKYQVFLNPSYKKWSLFMKDTITKEKLFIHCTYLAKSILNTIQ